MDPAVTSKGVVPSFDQHLDPLMKRAKNDVKKPVPANFQTGSGRTGSLTLRTDKEIKKVNYFSVWWPMVLTFGPSFFSGALMKIINGTLQYLLSKLAYWSREMVLNCQVVPYLVVPYYRGSPDSTNFVLPGNRTIVKLY